MQPYTNSASVLNPAGPTQMTGSITHLEEKDPHPGLRLPRVFPLYPLYHRICPKQ